MNSFHARSLQYLEMECRSSLSNHSDHGVILITGTDRNVHQMLTNCRIKCRDLVASAQTNELREIDLLIARPMLLDPIRQPQICAPQIPTITVELKFISNTTFWYFWCCRYPRYRCYLISHDVRISSRIAYIHFNHMVLRLIRYPTAHPCDQYMICVETVSQESRTTTACVSVYNSRAGPTRPRVELSDKIRSTLVVLNCRSANYITIWCLENASSWTLCPRRHPISNLLTSLERSFVNGVVQ